MNEVFLDLYKHNLWANQKLLAACESLPAEVLDADAKGTYGTIRDTLVHLLAAEGRYLSAISGQEQPPQMRSGKVTSRGSRRSRTEPA